MSTGRIAGHARRRWWHRGSRHPRPVAPVALAALAPAPPPITDAELVEVNRKVELRGVLADLERRVVDVRGTVVASRDGLALAATFPGAEADKVAAMAASVVSLAEQILHDPDHAGVATTVVRGGEGCLVVQAAGAGAVFAARTGPEANLGLVGVELPLAIAGLTKALG